MVWSTLWTTMALPLSAPFTTWTATVAALALPLLTLPLLTVAPVLAAVTARPPDLLHLHDGGLDDGRLGRRCGLGLGDGLGHNGL